MQAKNVIVCLLFTIIAILSLSSCSFISFMQNDRNIEQHERIVVEEESFTIRWADSDPNYHEGIVVGYQVFVRERGATQWTLLTEVSYLPISELTIDTSMLTYGAYDLGVLLYSSSENTSDMHTSLDDTANPTKGWYIDWRPKQTTEQASSV